MIEFATALRCLRLGSLLPWMRGRTQGDSDKQESSRRARLGRLAVYASLGFLVLDDPPAGLVDVSRDH